MHPDNVAAINGPPPLTCTCEECHVLICDLLIDTVILMLQDTSTSASNLVQAMDSLKRELLQTLCHHDRPMDFRASHVIQRVIQPSILDPEHEVYNTSLEHEVYNTSLEHEVYNTSSDSDSS